MTDSVFFNDFTNYTDKITCNYDTFMILEDLNKEKSSQLKYYVIFLISQTLLKKLHVSVKGWL